MQSILPWLSIGSYHDTTNRALLESYDVGAMLLLAADITHPGVVKLYLPIEDGEIISDESLRRGIDFILSQHASGQHVLVACGAGISRSTTFAIAAIKEAERLSLLEAARLVRRAYPNGMPHPALWSSLCRQYQEPLSYMDLVRAHEPER